MSTHAVLAYKHEGGKIFAKYCHYGDVHDYLNSVISSTSEEIIESVAHGDSSELFGGFYSDFEHCKDLGWDREMYERQLPDVKVKCFDDTAQLNEYAKSVYADYIYLLDNERITVFEYDSINKEYDDVASFRLENNSEGRDPKDIKVTRTGLTLDDVETILADGFADNCGFADVGCKIGEYQQAKHDLICTQHLTKGRLTHELIQAMMLANGANLYLTDHEGKQHQFGMPELINGINKVSEGKPKEWIEKLRDGEYDYYDLDAMLQTAVYGEVIYG